MTDETEFGPDPNQVRRHAKKMLTEREYRQRYRSADFYKPSPKQEEGHNAPKEISELFMQAATQSGKSTWAAHQLAFDATGTYPAWYKGKTFLTPPKIMRAHEFMAWVVSTSYQVQRAVMQSKLLGNLDAAEGLGTGSIPLDALVGKLVMQPGMSGVVQSFSVRRSTGGTANVAFRSADQSISAFAGASLDEIFWDEPGPYATYLECLARLTAVEGGRMIYTATPTEGRDPIFMRFQEASPHRRTIKMNLMDATHLSDEQVRAIIERTPEIDRPMRIYGEPAIGSGNVYTTPPEQFVHDRPIESFLNDPTIRWGMAADISHGGSASAFGVVFFCWDSLADVIWIVDCIKLHGKSLAEQVATIHRHPLGNCVLLFPHDSSQPGNAMTGETFAELFRAQGLRLAGEPVPKMSIADGVARVSERLATGRLRVGRRCTPWFDEFLGYHRKDGKFVQEFCDLMDATRYCCIGYKQSRGLGNDFAGNYAAPQRAIADACPWCNRSPCQCPGHRPDIDSIITAATRGY